MNFLSIGNLLTFSNKYLPKNVIQRHKVTHAVNEESDFIYAFMSKIKATSDPSSQFYGDNGCNHYFALINYRYRFDKK